MFCIVLHIEPPDDMLGEIVELGIVNIIFSFSEENVNMVPSELYN